MPPRPSFYCSRRHRWTAPERPEVLGSFKYEGKLDVPQILTKVRSAKSLPSACCFETCLGALRGAPELVNSWVNSISPSSHKFDVGNKLTICQTFGSILGTQFGVLREHFSGVGANLSPMSLRGSFWEPLQTHDPRRRGALEHVNTILHSRSPFSLHGGFRGHSGPQPIWSRYGTFSGDL